MGQADAMIYTQLKAQKLANRLNRKRYKQTLSLYRKRAKEMRQTARKIGPGMKKELEQGYRRLQGGTSVDYAGRGLAGTSAFQTARTRNFEDYQRGKAELSDYLGRLRSGSAASLGGVASAMMARQDRFDPSGIFSMMQQKRATETDDTLGYLFGGASFAASLLPLMFL